MSDVDKPLVLQKREVLGKGLGSLRGDGLVPAVIHNHGKESLHVMAQATDLAKVYKEAGKHHPLDLVVGDAKFLALIKDVHYNPVKRQMQHVVFQAIAANEKVEAEIPVHIIGEIPAEKVGLIVLHQLDTVQVEALPKDLPDEFTVEGSKLVELHDKLTVEDIKVPANVTILTEADHPIATVAETRAQVSEEAEAEATEGEAGEEGDTGATTEGEPAETASSES